MPFWKIAWRNMEQRALASALTALSMALGVAVTIAVIVIYGVAVRQFDQNGQGYHLIVGGKGGSLQLVLSTVYHIGQPLYPIPYSYYEKFLPGGEFGSVTAAAIPECLGDSYQSPDGSVFRVVGTTPELFEKIHYGTNPDGSPKSYEFEQGGRNFKTKNFFEGVIGSVVAARSGLKVGDSFQPSHGLAGGNDLHHAVKVVGILKPTGTADDRALFMNIEGFYLLPGHALSAASDQAEAGGAPGKESAAAEEHEHEEEQELEHKLERGEAQPLPVAQREVTSILVLCSNPLGPEYLNFKINKGKNRIAQAVAPAREVGMLMNGIVGPIQLVLLVLTVLVVIVAGISILVSIYNSMTERSHDIAVMRALGASRTAVMGIILVESILLSLGGGLIGVLIAHGMIGAAGPYVVERTGIALSMLQFDWHELVLIPGLVVLASLVGFLPALAAYRTDVSKALSGSR
ncbi:MAG TPA: FtsX-like permease family protein [Lacipirellulaceae bacterium]|nr:FtsX-like permease family protein [Lacipirellulaceae bacterium]